MKIETKADTGDNVWFMDNNRVIDAHVKSIEITKTINYDWSDIIKVKYTVEYKRDRMSRMYMVFSEDQIFKTKQDLLDSL